MDPGSLLSGSVNENFVDSSWPSESGSHSLGDLMSKPNGNMWGKPNIQDGVCTLGPVLGPIGDTCFPDRCKKHDECFTENQCNASSWTSNMLGGTKSCNKCNSGFFD